MRKTSFTIHLGDHDALELLGLSADADEVKVELRTAVIRELAKLLVHKMLPEDVRQVFDETVKTEVAHVLGEWVGGGWNNPRRFKITEPSTLEAIEQAVKGYCADATETGRAAAREAIREAHGKLGEWADAYVRDTLQKMLRESARNAVDEEARAYVAEKLARIDE